MGSLATFWLFATAAVTIVLELWRARYPTPIIMLTVGNLAYFGVNPVICHFAPESAAYFIMLVEQGSELTPDGLARLIGAAAIFQTGCLIAAAIPRPTTPAAPLELSPELCSGLERLGFVNIAIGLGGLVWLGMALGGTPLGFYQIDYRVRSLLTFNQGPAAFLLDVGKYGISVLVAVYTLQGRYLRAAAFVAVLLFHGLAMKSKLPVFHIACVFGVAASWRRGLIRVQTIVPLAVAAFMLSTLTIVRGATTLGELPAYLSRNQDLVFKSLETPWSSDLPGPGAGTYMVVNDPSVQPTLEPVAEIFTLLVPKVVYDRGTLVADKFAQKMFRGEFAPGIGPGWSTINDGYLILGLAGVLVVGFACAYLGRMLDRLAHGPHRELGAVMVSVFAPLIIFSARNSIGGSVKVLLLAYLVSLAPWRLFGSVAKPAQQRVTA